MVNLAKNKYNKIRIRLKNSKKKTNKMQDLAVLDFRIPSIASISILFTNKLFIFNILVWIKN